MLTWRITHDNAVALKGWRPVATLSELTDPAAVERHSQTFAGLGGRGFSSSMACRSLGTTSFALTANCTTPSPSWRWSSATSIPSTVSSASESSTGAPQGPCGRCGALALRPSPACNTAPRPWARNTPTGPRSTRRTGATRSRASCGSPETASSTSYRGEGLRGPQRLNAGGNALLEQARVDKAPVRFWYRPAGGRFTFLAWVAVLGRAWVSGVGQDRQPRPELEWRLEAVPGPSTEQWPSDVVAAVEESAALADDDDDATPPEAQAAPSYAALIARIDRLGQARRPNGIVRTNYPRSAATRRAVLVRSGGQCESPRCTGMPAELTRRGQPILDVDHIQDLAKGGEDHPRNMVALCPNCHACKTRGANATLWRRDLTRVARAAHDTAIGLDSA